MLPLRNRTLHSKPYNSVAVRIELHIIAPVRFLGREYQREGSVVTSYLYCTFHLVAGLSIESLLGLSRVQTSTVQPLCHIINRLSVTLKHNPPIPYPHRLADSLTAPRSESFGNFLRRLGIALASTFLYVSWFSYVCT